MSEQNTVIIVKLMNGQELIAKLVEETPVSLTISSPLTLQPGRSPEGGISLALLPFSWGSTETIVQLNLIHVLCVMRPDSQLETQYLAGLAGLVAAGPGDVPKSPKLTLVE